MEAKATFPLPKSGAVLEQFICNVLRLNKLTLLEVTPRGVRLERHVEEGDPAIPASLQSMVRGETPLDPDLEFLLRGIVVKQLPFAPERHILHTLIEVFQAMEGLRVAAIFAATGDALPAALGLPPATTVATLFGYPVHLVAEGIESGQLLLVGSPTEFLADAVLGVIADIGEAT